jgi:two-component system cell cycle sensor histidine kinase/response regulator CckA
MRQTAGIHVPAHLPSLQPDAKIRGLVPSHPTARQLTSSRLSPHAFEDLFRQLQEGLYVGLVGPDDSATLAANPHVRAIFGWPAEAPEAVVRPLDPDRFVDEQSRAEFLASLRRDGAVRDHLLRLRRVDGAAMWVEVTARGIPLESVPTVRVEAMMRDITDRKRVQDQSRDLYQQLAQSEKLAALGQTMSGVAHELNNPLATILACAERLSGRRLDESTRRDLDAIHNAAERAARIVRNLQTFARKRHTTRSTVDLNQVVRETLALRTYEQRAGAVTIVEQLSDGLPPVFVDPHQIQQIVLNLLINAEQAMVDAHGRGTLRLRSWAEPDRDAVVLEVNDDGPGVPEEMQARVFDPFFTTKAVGKGTGLGLSVAYAIAQEHGGRITVGPSAEGGASFLLELPVGGLRVRPPEAIQAVTLPPVPKGTRVLVIEDEAALGDAVAAALADEGFRPDRAADGEEALRRIRERHYDVIVCDLKMPRVDGIAFFRDVSAKMPHIARRLIFVTGDVAGTDAERFLEESGCRWVPKPFRLKDLVRLARETLR